MRHRHVVSCLAVGLLAGGLAAVPAQAATAAAPAGEGSAYGLELTGPVKVPPVPAVASTTEEVSKRLLHENHTDLADAAALDVSAAPARARSTVARLAVPSADLLAKAVSAKCVDGRGSAHLARAVLAGKRLDVSPPPNTTVPVDVDGVGRTALILNKQQRTADGRLAVTAIELALPGDKGTLRVASATCGRAPERPAEAPAPKPVEHDIPVTG